MSLVQSSAYLSLSVAGKPVLDQRGELVCVKPFPSMPVYFWKDEGGAKYKKAYFSAFPGKDALESSKQTHTRVHTHAHAHTRLCLSLVLGVWCHGDFIIINSATGGIEMLGRR